MSDKKQAAKMNNDNTITLDEAIQRGDQTITGITVRQPKAGEMRGISLLDLAQMDVAALEKILPRITQPALSKDEVAKLSPADLMQIAVKVANFLLTKEQKTDYPTT